MKTRSWPSTWRATRAAGWLASTGRSSPLALDAQGQDVGRLDLDVHVAI